MPHPMRPQPFATLLHWIRHELQARDSILGLPRALFYRPPAAAPYQSTLFGQPLGTPVGPAAGPHTQLAQNIVSAWLCGGRFIELKTVQIMDELEIPRPCIDMADEGYNVEWSQELKLEQSAGEYIAAWALVHILHHLLGFPGPVATIFNMSVGYNLEGIRSAPLTRFMDRLADAGEEIAALRQALQHQEPQLAEIAIPPQVVHSVTLSTMHGCPPDEIERIARYLIEERGLHTTVKLNPTLLGKETVLGILHDDLGYREIDIPDAVFAHDLGYERAVALVRALQEAAAARGVAFSVKLSNTLAMANHRGTLPGSEMYMSGRALYPLTMALFDRLAHEFQGKLAVSYSAGADALNAATLLACGARPITAASDLLKPGGYARLRQYVEQIAAEMAARGAASLDDLACDRLATLAHAAAAARHDPRYQKHYHTGVLPRVETALGPWDCIAAPCVAQCAVCQDVPDYAWLIAHGEDDRALEMVLARNPLPAVTGHVCTHLCQTRCTRHNYEEPVAIRALKRFAAEHGSVAPRPAAATGHRAAVVGAGPSGLAAAYFLALNGLQVTVYEAKDRAGGMLGLAPAFRLPPAVVAADMARITALGVHLELNRPVVGPPEELLAAGYDAVYLACGFPRDARLEIEGAEGPGVYPALELLEQAARGASPALGERVLVIGGGNTAMDAARTAQRLTGRPATVVYRRTRAEMPAEEEEVADLLAEGNTILELVSPVRVVRSGGRVAGLECRRNELGEPDASGRRRPRPLPGSDFTLEASAIVAAIGQQAEAPFLEGSAVVVRDGGAIAVDAASAQTAVPGVYAGGDAVRGPETIIAACADGRRAAEAICRQLGLTFQPPLARPAVLAEDEIVRVKGARARQEPQQRPAALPAAERGRSDLVEATLDEAAARREAARCLQCATFCDKCVEVCPNRANHAFQVAPVRWQLPLLACGAGRLAVVGQEAFAIAQPRQIVHLADLCNECGNCATFCVHPGRPYADKPRLFLNEADFARAEGNAFWLAGEAILRHEGGQELRLARQRDGWLYEDAHVRVRLGPEWTIAAMSLQQPFSGTLSLHAAAEMAVLLTGIRESLPFLALER